MNGKLLFQTGGFLLLLLIVKMIVPAQTGKILSAEEMRADLDTLRAILVESHPNLYRSASKNETEKRWRRARARIGRPLSTIEFLNLVSPLVNQYDDAHTYMDLPWETDYFGAYVKNGGLFFPFKVWLKGEKLFVAASRGETLLEAGTEIVAINGKSVKDMLKDLRPLAGGDSNAGRDNNLSRLFAFFMWQKYRAGKFDLKVRRPKRSKTETVSAAGIGYDALAKELFGEKAVDGYELTPGIFVLEVNKMQSRDEVKKYIDDAFAQIREKRYPFLVIDLRKNGGGNSVVGDWVFRYLTRRSYNQGGTKEVRVSPYLLENNKFYKSWIPKLKEKYAETGGRIVMQYTGEDDRIDNEKWVYEGKVLMVTSPQTYSSGFMMAEAFKCYGFGRIVGTEPGSYRNLTGELMQFKLPNSKLAGYVSTAQYFPPCYQKAKTDFLAPDIPVEQTAEDLAAGRDAVLEYVKGLSAGN